MKLVNKSLEQTLAELAKTKPEGFPSGHSSHPYHKRYQSLSDKLHADFHNNVLAGQMIVDGGLLTDHGSSHIKTVIARAGLLLSDESNTFELSPYEIYILLVAIHFHDMGNILGREGHEKRIDELMEHVESHLGDSAEKRCIRDIATAHGGRIGKNKDTFAYLSQQEPIESCDVRSRLLAGILRFADELADDKDRANRILQRLGIIPDGSEIFHKYASCLQSVMIRPESKSVDLHFIVNINDFTRKFGKINSVTKRVSKVFLLDEILERTLKTHLERSYCNRVMAPFVDIKTIKVEISCTKKRQGIDEELPTISYRLEEKGYPTEPEDGIYSLDNGLANWHGTKKRINGKTFANHITKISKTNQEVSNE